MASLQDRVLEQLRKTTFPKCNRENVKIEGSDNRAMCLGYYTRYGKHGLTENTTRKYCDLTYLLTQLCLQEHKGFGFTSIQVNNSVQAKLHVDRSNKGPSKIICLGDFQGGELWYHDGTGPVEREITKGLRKGGYEAGKRLKGSLYPTRNTWVDFDGNNAHATEPFTGERYAIIFFANKSFYGCPVNVLFHLRALGFGNHCDNPHQETINETLGDAVNPSLSANAYDSDDVLLPVNDESSDEEDVVKNDAALPIVIESSQPAVPSDEAIPAPTPASGDEAIVQQLLDEIERQQNRHDSADTALREEHAAVLAAKDEELAECRRRIQEQEALIAELHKKLDHGTTVNGRGPPEDVLEPDAKRPRFESGE